LTRLPKVRFRKYWQLDGTQKILVQQVGDGSIIKRFDKTNVPQMRTDVVCPHFLELKWAYGCPFDCAWCYLKGTLRLLNTKTKPVIKDYNKIRTHLESLFRNNGQSSEVLNTGELADSLMTENTQKPFSNFIISLFEEQNRHKVLLVTKSANVANLLRRGKHTQVIASFSLNAPSVARTWERAPPVEKRIDAGEILSKAGYEIRVRVDPIVPIRKWKKEYFGLVDLVLSRFLPERITLGSLRGLQSTINNTKDESWIRFLEENSNWGKKVTFEKRYLMYSTLIEYLRTKYDYTRVGLCKETVEMWNRLDMDYTNILCNCTL